MPLCFIKRLDYKVKEPLMYKEIQAKVHKESREGTYFLVLVPHESLTDEVKKLSDNGILKGELRIDDGRRITAEQRKKAYATLGDIADQLGYPPEDLKEIMKYRYIAFTGADYFSLSDCDVTTARHFINHLIDFAFEWSIRLMDTVINRTDDINAAIYASLKHMRCIICGVPGEVHHWDPIGMGRNRHKVDDSNHRKLCLCRIHHTEAHTIGFLEFEELYHVYGIIYKE
jgi:hypothetical protein